MKGFLPKLKRTPKAVMFGLMLSSISQFGQATVVEIRTSLGPIKVNLFDETTPETVDNFLTYVRNGEYINNVVHRVEPGFVIQAGGFKYDEVEILEPLCPNDSCTKIVNEPKLSNVRGTIAMAKQGGNVNSATSQWFFNLKDNSAGSGRLDTQNGGFSVFGQVIDDGVGMEVIEAIAKVKVFDASTVLNSAAFASLPLRNYVSGDITADNLVIISDVEVIDPAVSTHPEIVPANNTLINSSNGGGSNSGGGGALGWLSLIALLLLGRRVRRV